MKQTVFTGAACAIVTPFDGNRKVDYKALKKQIDFQIENGTDAIVVCGTTGESATLDSRERRQVIKTAVKQVNGKVPVIAGTGGNNTQDVIKKSQSAESLGVDALLIVTPYYNKCSQEGLVEHYSRISDSVTKPIIVYNVPSRTGVNIKPETYKRLSQIENVVATKEANGDLSALMKTLMLCGDELDIYCGNDDQSAAFTLLGGKGTISVLSNIMPQASHDIVSAALDGNADYATALQLRYLGLCNVLFCDVNPMPIKYAMAQMGTDSGVCRLPLTRPSDSAKERIDYTLRYHGLIE
jgi:4-hydroxy-tetrahydrodipicolinate synthase